MVATFAVFFFVADVFAQAPVASGSVAPPFSEEELEQLVGPIALYPDDLIAIILPASTNPLQIVQADRFLEKRKASPQLPVDEKWDDAVKSLLNYPDVVKTMSNDIDWTASLGEAVVADQTSVLAAVQTFRRKTHAAGNLKTDDKQTVVVEQEVVKIVPADPQVIYVPQYNPSTVVVAGGAPSYGYYPSPYPVYYYPYPPGAAFATGLVWGAALGAAWHGGRYSTNYGGGGTANINIDRSTNVGAVNRANVSSTQWKSNKQPGQVRNTTARSSSARVGYNTPSRSAGYTGGGTARTSTQSTGSVKSGGANRANASSANMNRASPVSSGNINRTSANGGAFGGYSSGYQAHQDSSRGASSRSSMSSGGARQVQAGGGGRGGGGGRR